MESTEALWREMLQDNFYTFKDSYYGLKGSLDIEMTENLLVRDALGDN